MKRKLIFLTTALIFIISLTSCMLGNSSKPGSTDKEEPGFDEPDNFVQPSTPEIPSEPSTPTNPDKPSTPAKPDKSNGYFFDGTSATSGDGTIENPYNNLSYIKTLDLNLKHNIYLKRGSKFRGSIELSNASGTEKDKILITSYGDGELPIIDGNDKVGDAVVSLKNCNNITISNLEIFDSSTTEADRRGVLILGNNPNNNSKIITYSNITLDGLYIHDINGITDKENSGMSAESKKTGGIHFGSLDGKAKFDNLIIKNCKIKNVSNVGIASWYKFGSTSNKVSPYSDKFKDTAYTNILIENNDISYIGKNAIFVRNLLGGYVKNNVVYETAIKCISGNSIVTSYVDGTVIEYNEGYYNRASAKSDGKIQDGCMLDADLQSKNTIWQYNYSHDNSFGLFLNCTSYSEKNKIEDDVIVRYNLSVNDKGTYGIIYINYSAKMIEVYNNTIVTGSDTSVIFQTNSGTNSKFYNNLIYNRSKNATFKVNSSSNVDISNNLIYSDEFGAISNLSTFKTLNYNGVYENPLFIKELPKNSICGIDAAKYYKVASNSIVYNSALDVTSVNDFFGNKYKNAIGFYCG